jgi:hypothetical protein
MIIPAQAKLNGISRKTKINQIKIRYSTPKKRIPFFKKNKTKLWVCRTNLLDTIGWAMVVDS